MGDPKTFCFQRRIDGAQYGFNIPCRDWTEAQKIADANLWRLDGELMATIPAVMPNWFVNMIVRVRNAWKD